MSMEQRPSPATPGAGFPGGPNGNAAPETPEAVTASPRRIAANRANAQKSTGPRTPEGKAKSRANAVKHGLYVQHLELAAAALDDEREELDALLADLRERYQPQGTEEEWIVDRLAATWWDLARIHKHRQAYLAKVITAWERDPYRALCETQASGALESRLERTLTRLRKDLAFLQRWRSPEAGQSGAAADPRQEPRAETGALRAPEDGEENDDSGGRTPEARASGHGQATESGGELLQALRRLGFGRKAHPDQQAGSKTQERSQIGKGAA